MEKERKNIKLKNVCTNFYCITAVNVVKSKKVIKILVYDCMNLIQRFRIFAQFYFWHFEKKKFQSEFLHLH